MVEDPLLSYDSSEIFQETGKPQTSSEAAEAAQTEVTQNEEPSSGEHEFSVLYHGGV